jgi:hypothetical protein
MNRWIVFTACVLSCGTAAAQNTATSDRAKHERKLILSQKSAVAGVIRDAHNRPIRGAQAFIYQPDSSIIASGYTDSMGYYETNALPPGSFDLKIVYPNDRIIYVKGITVKKGITPINLKADLPSQDTMISYSDIAPKPEEKKTHMRKK